VVGASPVVVTLPAGLGEVQVGFDVRPPSDLLILPEDQAIDFTLTLEP
jgi:hypothetical protein